MCRFVNPLICFAGTLLICAVLLFCVCALIPQESIREGCLKSEVYFSSNEGFPLLFESNLGSRLDNYADAALINVIYNVDSSRPFYSMIAAPYYRIAGNDIRADYRSAVLDQQAPNNEYSRYWHGSQVLIRPLLMFTSVSGCRAALFVLLLLLNAGLAVLLWRQNAKRPLFIYLFSLLSVQFFMAAFTLEYIMTFLVASFLCVAAAFAFSRGLPAQTLQRYMTHLMIVSGAVTCFLDFLTTETLTFTIPFLLFMMLYKERAYPALTLKQTFGLFVRWGMVWLAAYAAMFLIKWLLVLLILGSSAFTGIFSSAAYRIDRMIPGQGGQAAATVFSSRLPMMLARNLGCLFPFSASLSVPLTLWMSLGILFVLACVFYLFRSSKADGAFIAGQLLAGLIPYLRFLALSSHAYDHYFFTYRAQMATVMALCAVMAYSLNPAEVLKPRKAKRTSRR